MQAQAAESSGYVEPPSTMLGKTGTALVLWPTIWADGVRAYSFLRSALTLRSISAAVAPRALIGRTIVAPRTKTSAVRSVILLMGGVRFMRVVIGLFSNNLSSQIQIL
jgi:hypothetical protein